MKRLFIVAFAVSVACGPPSPPVSTPTSDGVTLWLNHNAVSFAAPPVLGDLVDLGLFGPFRPDQTISDVRRTTGEPKAVRKDYRGTFYHYPVGAHEVATAHLTSSSSGFTWQNWSVYAFPTDASADAVFKGALRDQFRNRSLAGDLVLSVVSGGQDNRISAVVGGGRVTDLRWYRVRN